MTKAERAKIKKGCVLCSALLPNHKEHARLSGQVIELLKDGYSTRNIAEALEITWSVVYMIENEHLKAHPKERFNCACGRHREHIGMCHERWLRRKKQIEEFGF